MRSDVMWWWMLVMAATGAGAVDRTTEDPAGMTCVVEPEVWAEGATERRRAAAVVVKCREREFCGTLFGLEGGWTAWAGRGSESPPGYAVGCVSASRLGLSRFNIPYQWPEILGPDLLQADNGWVTKLPRQGPFPAPGPTPYPCIAVRLHNKALFAIRDEELIGNDSLVGGRAEPHVQVLCGCFDADAPCNRLRSDGKGFRLDGAARTWLQANGAFLSARLGEFASAREVALNQNWCQYRFPGPAGRVWTGNVRCLIPCCLAVVDARKPWGEGSFYAAGCSDYCPEESLVPDRYQCHSIKSSRFYFPHAPEKAALLCFCRGQWCNIDRHKSPHPANLHPFYENWEVRRLREDEGFTTAVNFSYPDLGHNLIDANLEADLTQRRESRKVGRLSKRAAEPRNFSQTTCLCPEVPDSAQGARPTLVFILAALVIFALPIYLSSD